MRGPALGIIDGDADEGPRCRPAPEHGGSLFEAENGARPVGQSSLNQCVQAIEDVLLAASRAASAEPARRAA